MPHLNREFNKTLSEIPVDRLRLLEDRIICRIVKRPRRMGRFFVAGTWEYAVKTSIGRVLRLGEDYHGPLKTGDYVIYETWMGREAPSPDETLIILRPDHIMALIDVDESP